MIEYEPALPIFSRGKPPNHSRPSSSLHIKRNSHFQEKQHEQKWYNERVHSRQSQKALEQYQQNWENEILRQLAEDLSQDTEVDHLRQMQFQGDRFPRQIKSKMTDKHIPKLKRKDFQKYRAYAVKMKIPSYQDIYKIKAKDQRQPSKPAINNHHLKVIQDLIHPKLSIINQTALKQQFLRYESAVHQSDISRREVKTSAKERKIVIRKRSLKPHEKRTQKQVNEVIKKIQNNYGKNPTASPKGFKKFKIVSQKDYITPFEPNRAINAKEELRDPFHIMDRGSPRTRVSVLQTLQKSQKNEQRKQAVSVSPNRSDHQDANYLQKGISFKKKLISTLESKMPDLVVPFPPPPSLPCQQIPQVETKLNNYGSSSQKMKKIFSYDESPYLQGLRESPSKNIKKRSRDIKTKDKVVVELDRKPSKEILSPSPVKYPQKGRVLVFNSEDKYIKYVLLQNNWVVNPDTRSHFYNLKWVFKPIPQDYNNLTQKQYLNHIKNSHELTSKNYLNKNLKLYLPQWPTLHKNYPKCFDFSKSEEKQQFQEEYTQNFMMLLLRKIYHYLTQTQPSQTSKYMKIYEMLLQNDGSYDTDSKFTSQMRKKQFRNMDMQNYRFFDQNCSIHMNLVIIALKYWRLLRKKKELDEDEHYHFLTYNLKQFESNCQLLEQYSQQSMTFDPKRDSQYFIKEYFSTPSSLTIERIVKEYVYFQRNQGKQWKTFGDRNVWIVKPCSASRGNGIYLEDNSNSILFNSKGIQTKIVQKYIERPLLFASPLLRNKKFDIRQWVLLRCVNPLQIYIFSHCYIRICSQQYSISNIQNLKSHLTNYSFNKKHFKDSSESVMDYDTFKTLLKEQCKVDYESQIKPKIKDIVINSIKAGQEHLHDMGKRCFSLLGYDILLDQDCNPWLLEVNMSPACEQRTQWLKEYLKAMGQGLLKIVLPQQYWQNQDVQLVNSKSRIGVGKSSKKQKRLTHESDRLNRVRTDISQEFVNKEKGNILPKVIDPRSQEQELEDICNELTKSQYEEIPMDYEPLVKENCFQKEETQLYDEDEEWERVYTVDFEDNFKEESEEEVDLKIKEEESNALQSKPLKKHQFEEVSQKKKTDQNEEDSEKSTKNQKKLAAPPNLIFTSPEDLKWELICFQQYSFPQKKDPQNFEAVGIKISLQFIKDNDVQLDQYEQSKNHLEQSILKLQKTVRTFLTLKTLKNNPRDEQQSKRQKLRINFSRIGRNFSEKDSRSVTLQEDLSSSIWHYNYYHTYRQHTIEKRYIQKQKINASNIHRSVRNSYKELKNKGSPERLKNKIKSFVGESCCYDLQEIVLKHREKKEEGRRKTESIGVQQDETGLCRQALQSVQLFRNAFE